MEEKNWGAEPWRAPTPEETDTVIFSEHGRGLDKVCYRAFWLMLVKHQFGGYSILVKHGGGQESIHLPSAGRYHLPESLALLDSDARFLMLFQMFRIKTNARRAGEEKARQELMTAFAENRLKKRKVRGQNAVRIEVVRKLQEAQ